MPADPSQVIANLRELAALTSDATARIASPSRPPGSKPATGSPPGSAAFPSLATSTPQAMPGSLSPERRLALSSSAPTSIPSPTAAGWTEHSESSPPSKSSPPSPATPTVDRLSPSVLVDWADEEGARFGRSLFGSSAFAGTHSIEADRNRTDHDGVTLEAALAKCNINIDSIGRRPASVRTSPPTSSFTSSKGLC